VPGVPRRLPYGPAASSASSALRRTERPTVARSIASPAAAPAATTPIAAPTRPARSHFTPSPIRPLYRAPV